MRLGLARLVTHVAQLEMLLIVENSKGLAVHYEECGRNLLLVVCRVMQIVVKMLIDLAHEHIFTGVRGATNDVVERLVVVLAVLRVLAGGAEKQVPARRLVSQHILTRVHEPLRVLLELMSHVKILNLARRRALADLRRVGVLARYASKHVALHG